MLHVEECHNQCAICSETLSGTNGVPWLFLYLRRINPPYVFYQIDMEWGWQRSNHKDYLAKLQGKDSMTESIAYLCQCHPSLFPSSLNGNYEWSIVLVRLIRHGLTNSATLFSRFNIVLCNVHTYWRGNEDLGIIVAWKWTKKIHNCCHHYGRLPVVQNTT